MLTLGETSDQVGSVGSRCGSAHSVYTCGAQQQHPGRPLLLHCAPQTREARKRLLPSLACVGCPIRSPPHRRQQLVPPLEVKEQGVAALDAVHLRGDMGGEQAGVLLASSRRTGRGLHAPPQTPVPRQAQVAVRHAPGTGCSAAWSA